MRLRWKLGTNEYVEVYEHRVQDGVVVGGEVHHKNGIRSDNRPENLERCTNRSDHMRHHRLADDQVEHLYRQGWTTTKIADELKLNSSSVYRSLIRSGVPIRPTHEQLRKDLPPEAAKLYADGWSIARIATKLGVSQSLVHRRLVEAGVAMRPPGRQKRA